ALYSDPDGHAWQSTQWDIRTPAGTVVWQTGFLSDPPLALYRVNFSDGAFVGPLAGQTQLGFGTNYELHVRYRAATTETSAPAAPPPQTPAEPAPGGGPWIARQGYVVEPFTPGLRLPVDIAFLPTPGTAPTDILFYVTELYGSIKLVRNNGTATTFAIGLLD